MQEARRVAGGDINDAYAVTLEGGARAFVKTRTGAASGEYPTHSSPTLMSAVPSEPALDASAYPTVPSPPWTVWTTPDVPCADCPPETLYG